MQASQQGFNPIYSEDAPTIDEVNALNDYVILEFGASWCGHCQAAAPAVQQSLSETPFDSLAHIKVADGKGKRLGRAFKVKLWPTLILLNNGEEVARLIRPTQALDVDDFLRDSLNHKA